MESFPSRLAGSLVLGVALAATACARQGAPPGGPEDRRPPVVVATTPDTFAVLTEPFRGPVVFTFDERVSERVEGGGLDRAVVVSPRTGAVRVSHGRQSISVEIEGGFRPGLVYRVTLLPVVRDLFNNQLLGPFDLVFSTGGDFNRSAVAGTAWDRTTGDGVDALEVVATPVEAGDSIAHVTRSDTAGVYIFRYLPPGRYTVVAYQDRNRNQAVDRMEIQGDAGFEVTGPDTVFVDVPVLQPDTTPARLTRAQVLDSLTVLLDFDDFLEPLSAAGLMGVTVTREETGAIVPTEILHEREHTALRAQLQDSFSRLDSLDAARRAGTPPGGPPPAPDSLAQDTVSVEAGPGPERQGGRASRPIPPALPAASGGGQPPQGGRPGAPQIEPLTPDGRPLPSRRLVLRVGEALEINAPYKVFAGSVVNINGVSGGGGESALVREPPPDTVVADSAAADTVAVPDTAQLGRASTGSDPSGGTPGPERGVPFLPGRRW